jgi:PAS domain S-box-containing protein
MGLVALAGPLRPAGVHAAAQSAPSPSGQPSDRSAAGPTPTGILTRIPDVRRVGTSVLGRHARVTGVVTYFDPVWGLMFVQDTEEGVFVFMTGVDSAVHAGDLVRVDGTVEPGDFAPSISKPVVAILGRSPMPPAVRPDNDTLATGRLDSQFVELEGVVHGFRPLNDEHVSFDVTVGPSDVLVTLPGRWHGEIPSHLVDARVRLRGVCGTLFNPRRQLVGLQLFLSSFDQLTVVEAPLSDPFAAPLRPIQNLYRWSSLPAQGHRVRMSGKVTWRNGRQIYVRDHTGNIAVKLWNETISVVPGDNVDVVGFPATGPYSPVLEDAIARVIPDSGGDAKPTMVTAATMLQGDQDGGLVTIDASLESAATAPEPSLVLRASGLLFTATLPANSDPQAAQIVLPEPGSLVRVTGVSRVQVNMVDTPRVPRGVQLLLRTPADIVVLKPAPWWTGRRATEVLGGVALITVGAVGWILALRRRVARQTGEILTRLHREEALRAQYHELFETANDIVVTCDTEGRLSAINTAGERATGYPRPTAIGMPLSDLVAPADRVRFHERLTECLRLAGGATFEVSLVRPDGGTVAIEFDAHRIFEHGAVAGVQAIGRDVTERNRTAEELERAKVAAEAANRAKSEFVANISHEVRTPLNGIIGMTELLQAGNLSDDERQYLGLMRTSADSLLHVINDVLDLSKIESGHLELTSGPFDLVARLEAIVEPLAVMARRKGLAFLMTIAPELPPVLIGDMDRVGQVLTNLVGNAVKFTDAGRVALAVTVGVPEPGDTPATCRIRFGVTDTGIGIAGDKHAVIFEAFTQADGSTSRRYGGTGLGLAIATSLVRRMGGALTLDSVPRQGSTFTAQLPFTRGERASIPLDSGADCLSRLLGPTAQASPWSTTRAARPLAVLLVEDNPVNQRLALEILTRRGHRITVADNGREALERLAAASPDIILMDVQMPEMNGLEATEAIRALERGTGRHVPIVAMTAHAMSGDRAKCLDAGMDDYMTKPIRAAALVTLVERLGMPTQVHVEIDQMATHVTHVNHAAPAVIDMAAALDRVDGDRALLGEIAGIFLADVAAMLSAVHAALNDGDPTGLTRAAHRLKGSVMTFAAGPASKTAQALEQLGHHGSMAGADALVATLDAEVALLIEALEPLAKPQQPTRG